MTFLGSAWIEHVNAVVNPALEVIVKVRNHARSAVVLQTPFLCFRLRQTAAHCAVSQALQHHCPIIVLLAPLVPVVSQLQTWIAFDFSMMRENVLRQSEVPLTA